MQPESPVYDNAEELWGVKEVVYAKDQPEYKPLPAIRFRDGVVVTRWHMTWKERIAAFLSGDIYLSMLTFNQPLTPVVVSTSGLEACQVSYDVTPEVANA